MTNTPGVGDHAAATTAPPIWYQGKRVLRTIVQTIVGGIALVAGIQVIAPQVLDAVKDVLPAAWVPSIVGAIAFVGAVAGALSRVMAIPAVNTFLTKYLALGSVPASTLTSDAEDVGKA